MDHPARIRQSATHHSTHINHQVGSNRPHQNASRIDISENKNKPRLTERQKKNQKIQQRMHHLSFPSTKKDDIKPYILALNQYPETTIRLNSSSFTSKKVVGTDNMGKNILFMAQFHELDEEDPVVNGLSEIIRDLHMMGKNRYPIRPKNLISGTMKGIGFRGGMEGDHSAAVVLVGTYARVSKIKEEARQRDEALWDKLPAHNLFLCDRLRHFSQQAFENNVSLLERFGLPSWSDSEWTEFANDDTRAFTNAIVTNNNFVNEPHKDDDENEFSYGIFSYINPENGQPICPITSASGHAIRFPEFNCEIDFGTSPGIIEVIWATNRVVHHTTSPSSPLRTTKQMMHFGSSFQTGKTLIERAVILDELPPDQKAKRIFGRSERNEVEDLRASKRTK
ncbi:uncharacterized protein PGTG_00441 [Puccinia graminis f. sp. tritici CRL 75-36-700-3]|uniref:Tet-like 2OG-Fe(II) oxygenase domain-containing protein n=1 Tax=Puccinia graminis f. sp. tritici (strain CRL 75-36-700-3 / race SCCL) TaxID=418459 RepID=E3JQH3_PUCGT|nr:uncharacterized protein PGTG_00441 [Puccinia graminis f. sp. tritici CRL 75-36-700-3]EFP74485.1 hypothetical protein PGTG_00441 [Puccinia graminis f. sp. tritici CRL 75-36-700-3]